MNIIRNGKIVEWPEVFRRLEAMNVVKGSKIWGVPRGGQIIAGLLQALGRGEAVSSPEHATVIVDDIIDSGKTRARYPSEIPFRSLVDKQLECIKSWVSMPWELNETGPEDAVIRLLQFIGEDPSRNGLIDTPKRVLKAWKDLTVGYQQDAKAILNRSFEHPHDELILLRGARFTSCCEHHLLPFTGVAAIGYIPSPTGGVVGISKLARVLDCFARRLQLQERLTKQVADAITESLSPLGVGVVIRASHSCMSCRGCNQPDSELLTSVMQGILRDNTAARAEFLSLVRL